MKNITPDQKEKNRAEWLSDRAETYRIYVKTSAVGIEVALSVGVGAGLGFLCDRYFDSSPFGMLVGISLGAVAAGRAIYYFVKKYLQAEAKAVDQENDSDEANKRTGK